MLALSFVACNKTGVSNKNALDYETSISSARNTTDVMQRYALLTDNEKQTLWQNKIATILKNDKLALNKNQLAAVNELNTILANTGVVKLSSDNELNDKTLNAFSAKYQRYFSNKQFYYLVVSPYTYDGFSIVNIEKNKEAVLLSNQKLVSDGDDAPGCTCRSDWYCLTSTCDYGTCTRTTSGCGFFGGSSCKGRCDSVTGS